MLTLPQLARLIEEGSDSLPAQRSTTLPRIIMVLVALGVSFLLFLASRAVYRLWLSALAQFPGQKIAGMSNSSPHARHSCLNTALTSWYCAYHDILRGGQYIWVVEDMHRTYGPIVRISPDVLHVNDANFIEQLYPQSLLIRRERAQTFLNMFAEHLSVLPTRDHHLHRQRRAVLSRFFSQQNVRRLVPVINDTLKDLPDRMEGWGKGDSPIVLNVAYRAATKDVIQAYALGESQRCLHMEDCNVDFFKTLKADRLTHFSVHFHWWLNLMYLLPVRVLTALSPHLSVFIHFIEVRMLKSYH